MNILALLLLFSVGAMVAFNKIFGRSVYDELDREVAEIERRK